ncbi:hypothetical protein DPEC_G00307140 [Dallia pectoralis]|uniref:Uncharacterized protein n=1 Tax=Dallia pectoralis TaxID=75939 RepID=A0ACC2FE99_DALPE|nr:hypothetical protein DPEC_G00307140 [Dallia pectoralis]
MLRGGCLAVTTSRSNGKNTDRTGTQRVLRAHTAHSLTRTSEGLINGHPVTPAEVSGESLKTLCCSVSRGDTQNSQVLMELSLEETELCEEEAREKMKDGEKWGGGVGKDMEGN